MLIGVIGCGLCMVILTLLVDGALGGCVQHSKNHPPISGRELDRQLQAQLAQAKTSSKGSIERIGKVGAPVQTEAC